LREEKILQALARDLNYKEIAATLRISFHTVRTHTRNIYRKLGVHSKAQAVRKYFWEGGGSVGPGPRCAAPEGGGRYSHPGKWAERKGRRRRDFEDRAPSIQAVPKTASETYSSGSTLCFTMGKSSPGEGGEPAASFGRQWLKT
jgi:DNA-binding CsgD family transcriptional regulator